MAEDTGVAFAACRDTTTGASFGSIALVNITSFRTRVPIEIVRVNESASGALSRSRASYTGSSIFLKRVGVANTCDAAINRVTRLEYLHAALQYLAHLALGKGEVQSRVGIVFMGKFSVGLFVDNSVSVQGNLSIQLGHSLNGDAAQSFKDSVLTEHLSFPRH